MEREKEELEAYLQVCGCSERVDTGVRTKATKTVRKCCSLAEAGPEIRLAGRGGNCTMYSNTATVTRVAAATALDAGPRIPESLEAYVHPDTSNNSRLIPPNTEMIGLTIPKSV